MATRPDPRPFPPSTATYLSDSENFSLVLGGPTFQLFRKAHLAGAGLDLLVRRIVFIALFVWMPLLLLTLLSSSSTARTMFFQDVEVHARFLISLPVLIAAELIIHLRLRPVVRAFVERGIVATEDLPRFHNALESALKLRNSVVLELALLVTVYSVGLLVWNGRAGLDKPSWYALAGGRWHLTPAGYWYVFIGIPLFQFVLLRWYLRGFIWFRFLWRVCRLRLNLIPTHPDRCAGLGFLGKSAYAFSPIIFAQGAILSGLIATRVLYHGENLLSFKMQALGFVVIFVGAVLAPLLMFSPKMASAKRKGLADYGLLAQKYADLFQKKWVRNSNTSDELLGTGDIQSLADLGNSYDIVREMRAVPFNVQDITRLGAAATAPLVPLLLTIFSLEELVMRIIKTVF